MKITAVLSIMIAFTVIANLLLKQGAMAPVSERIILGLYSWKSFFGFVAFAFAGLIYAVVLRWLPLNVATSFTAIQFIAVIVASAVILAEPIPLVRWIGISLIAIGVLLVATTTNGVPTDESATSTKEQFEG